MFWSSASHSGSKLNEKVDSSKAESHYLVLTWIWWMLAWKVYIWSTFLSLSSTQVLHSWSVIVYFSSDNLNLCSQNKFSLKSFVHFKFLVLVSLKITFLVFNFHSSRCNCSASSTISAAEKLYTRSCPKSSVVDSGRQKATRYNQ